MVLTPTPIGNHVAISFHGETGMDPLTDTTGGMFNLLPFILKRPDISETVQILALKSFALTNHSEMVRTLRYENSRLGLIAYVHEN